jgi:SAM-dependent methyltransferase
MKPVVKFGTSLLMLLLSYNFLNLYSQEQAKNQGYTPHVGQPGKDVIWVPTPYELVDKMLDIAGVNNKDYVIDLGSGDGRTVIAAARLGAYAIGIEYNADMVELSKRKAAEAGLSEKTSFIKADLFEYDLSKATVITMFLLPEINLKLRPRLLNLKAGTRIVSNTFTMGEWEPDYEAATQGTWENWNTVLMWVVPAKLDGEWMIGSSRLTIHQEFQRIYGSIVNDEGLWAITDGKISGETISFNINDTTYTGKVSGDSRISGTMVSGAVKKEWSATRIERQTNMH